MSAQLISLAAAADAINEYFKLQGEAIKINAPQLYGEAKKGRFEAKYGVEIITTNELDKNKVELKKFVRVDDLSKLAKAIKETKSTKSTAKAAELAKTITI